MSPVHRMMAEINTALSDPSSPDQALSTLVERYFRLDEDDRAALAVALVMELVTREMLRRMQFRRDVTDRVRADSRQQTA
jgi:hypothetical protein